MAMLINQAKNLLEASQQSFASLAESTENLKQKPENTKEALYEVASALDSYVATIKKTHLDLNQIFDQLLDSYNDNEQSSGGSFSPCEASFDQYNSPYRNDFYYRSNIEASLKLVEELKVRRKFQPSTTVESSAKQTKFHILERRSFANIYYHVLNDKVFNYKAKANNSKTEEYLKDFFRLAAGSSPNVIIECFNSIEQQTLKASIKHEFFKLATINEQERMLIKTAGLQQDQNITLANLLAQIYLNHNESNDRYQSATADSLRTLSYCLDKLEANLKAYKKAIKQNSFDSLEMQDEVYQNVFNEIVNEVQDLYYNGRINGEAIQIMLDCLGETSNSLNKVKIYDKVFMETKVGDVMQALEIEMPATLADLRTVILPQLPDYIEI
jgi:hypothetical protein